MEKRANIKKYLYLLLVIVIFMSILEIVSAGQNTTRCTQDLSCSQNEFCNFPTGVCGGGGECTPKPEACAQVWMPVCGCDLKTYSNDCTRLIAGVSKLHEGECNNSSCIPHASFVCFDNDVYWYNSCNLIDEKKLECGKDSCGIFEGRYCKDGNVYSNRSCFHRGCSDDSCFTSPFEQEIGRAHV